MSARSNPTRPEGATPRVADLVASAQEAIEDGVRMAKEEVQEVIARLQERAAQA